MVGSTAAERAADHAVRSQLLAWRVIRVLTVNSKTFYFIDKGAQRGSVVARH